MTHFSSHTHLLFHLQGVDPTKCETAQKSAHAKLAAAMGSKRSSL